MLLDYYSSLSTYLTYIRIAINIHVPLPTRIVVRATDGL